MTSKYDVNAIRQKLKQSMSGKFTDPDEFKPDKAKSTTEAIKYRFFVLPPLFKGDVLKSGTVARSMDQFFISHANHWIMTSHILVLACGEAVVDVMSVNLDSIFSRKRKTKRTKTNAERSLNSGCRLPITWSTSFSPIGRVIRKIFVGK